MAHINGHSAILSDDAVKLSQKILSKFTLKPYQRKFSERPAYVSALIGPCPCDDCHMNPECAITSHQCKAFRCFVSTGRWLASEVSLNLR